MINLKGRPFNAEVRVEHANRAIHQIRNDLEQLKVAAEDVSNTVSEQQKHLQEHDELFHEYKEQLRFRDNKFNDALSQLNQAERRLKDLESIPAPLIPDLAPLRAEIRLVRAVIDELTISYNDEMSYLWTQLRDESRKRQELDTSLAQIKIPSLRPVYILVGVGFICQTLISIFF